MLLLVPKCIATELQQVPILKYTVMNRLAEKGVLRRQKER